MDYNITLTANHQSLTAEYLPIAAESVQYLTAKVVCETEDWTGREIKAMFGQGCTVHGISVTGGEITAKQQLNLTAGDWRVWLVGNSARDGEVIPRITTNVAHISVAPTGGTEGNPFPTVPPTVEEQLRADMGNLADLTTKDKSSLVAAINELEQSSAIPDWDQNDEDAQDYVKNRPGGYMSKTQQVSITVDADNNYEGFGHIEAGVGDAISIRIDDEIKTYTVKLNEQNVKYIGMSLGPVPPTVPPADLWVLIFDDDHYTILNFDKVAHTYVVDMSVPAKFDVKYLPDSVVQPRIVYIANSSNITEEDVAEACAKISVRDVDDVSRTHQVFYDKNRQILCVSGDFGNFLERVFIKQIKMDSAKTEQVIANVFTERISGIGYLYVADVANPRRLYCVSFFVDLTGNSAIGGIAAYNCVQTLAYINNHLFAFYIDDAAYDRKLLNGNLTIKKLL